MSYATTLRDALANAKSSKDKSRQAGEGIWANYVRHTMMHNTPRNADEFEQVHKGLVDTLNNINELTKDEKNSLRSAKCVVAKAVTNNVDVWQRDDAGLIVYENGEPMPKGKSELQEAKSDFDKMMGFITAATKKYESETRDVFTSDELRELATAYASLSHAMIEASQAQ